MGNLLVFIGTVLALIAGIVLVEDKLKQNHNFDNMLSSTRSSFNELVRWMSHQSNMTVLIQIGKYSGFVSLAILILLAVVQKLNFPIPTMLAVVFFFFASCSAALGWFVLLKKAWKVVIAIVLMTSLLPIFIGDYKFYLNHQVSSVCYALENSPFSCSLLENVPAGLKLTAFIFISSMITLLSASIISFILVFCIAAITAMVLEAASFLEENFTKSTFDAFVALMAIAGCTLGVIGAFLNL